MKKTNTVRSHWEHRHLWINIATFHFCNMKMQLCKTVLALGNYGPMDGWKTKQNQLWFPQSLRNFHGLTQIFTLEASQNFLLKQQRKILKASSCHQWKHTIFNLCYWKHEYTFLLEICRILHKFVQTWRSSEIDPSQWCLLFCVKIFTS